MYLRSTLGKDNHLTLVMYTCTLPTLYESSLVTHTLGAESA